MVEELCTFDDEDIVAKPFGLQLPSFAAQRAWRFRLLFRIMMRSVKELCNHDYTAPPADPPSQGLRGDDTGAEMVPRSAAHIRIPRALEARRS